MFAEFVDFLNAILVFILLSVLYKKQWVNRVFDFDREPHWLDNVILTIWVMIAGMSAAGFALKFYQWMGS